MRPRQSPSLQADPGAPQPERWLVLSHDFNMDGRAASLTITDKIPHLSARGIEPVVISATTGNPYRGITHHQVLPWGPSALRFDLRHVIANRIGRGLRYRLQTLLVSAVLAPFMLLERLLIGLRSQWSWALPAYWHAARLLKHERFDLVYSTGGAYSAHLAGYWLRRRLGCRWIAEVHDPMVVPGQTPATRDARMLAWIERKICENANLAWWFTDNALASARRRHPALAQRGIVVLPGADPPLVRVAYKRDRVFVIGHFGSLSPTRSLTPAVQALGQLLALTPALRLVVRLEVYGGAIDPEARRQIGTLGLADVVKEMGRLEHDPATGRSGRERVIERMQQVDILLLVHGTLPDCAEYIPSKLYDYFWGRRPVLALTHKNPQLDALVRAHQGRAVDTTDIAAIERSLLELIDLWRADSLHDVIQPPITVAQAVDKIVEAARHAG